MMSSLAIVNALRDGKVAIEEVEGIRLHAGIALKPLAVHGTSHHVNQRHDAQ
jgi:hypothetical protein